MATGYPEVTAHDVAEIAQLIDRHHIDFHLDGG